MYCVHELYCVNCGYWVYVGDALSDALGGVLGDLVCDVLGHVLGGLVGGVLGDVLGDVLGGVLDHVLGDVRGDVSGHMFGLLCYLNEVDVLRALRIVCVFVALLVHVRGCVLGVVLGCLL